MTTTATYLLRQTKLTLVIAISVLALSAHAVGTAKECAPSDAKSGSVFGVSGSNIELREAPRLAAPKIINEKATQVLRTKQYAVIDKSTRVVEQCRRGDWSRVQVKEPEWLSTTHVGWVPSKVLRPVLRASSGGERFTEQDFQWDSKIFRHKGLIVDSVNRIHREVPGCNVIDPYSAYLSGQRSSPSKPVFFVACGRGAQAFNVYFSESGIEKR